MLRIGRLTDYGIVLLAHLAEDEDGATHNARELAERAHLPLPAVSKILKALAQRGLLVSHRGAKGGYGLARPAAEISVAECTLGPGHCEQEVDCMTRLPWQRINRAIQEALARVSLAELAGAPGGARIEAAPRIVDAARR